jgi:hypothetical protein
MRLPIFFYHNSAQSLPRIGFGVFVTPPVLIAILLKREFPLKTLIEMAVIGRQKCFSVIAILLLIGAVMAV